MSAINRRELIALAGAAALPIAARAQQPALPVIGHLGRSSEAGYAELLTTFRLGLREAGFVEGQNVTIEHRWADDQNDRLPAMAADLVDRRVNVIFTSGGTSSALAAKRATATIPIVFTVGGDPVESGLVVSLNRPGGNMTGMSSFSELLITKRFELARELVSKSKVVGFLLNPNSPNTGIRERAVQEAARSAGQQIRVLNASNARQFDAAFATLVQEHVDVLVVGDDPLFNTGRAQLVVLAARHAVPVIYQYRAFAVAGGLMSYGPIQPDNYRRAGIYVGRILKGERPSDLPVMLPTKFELVINLKTAKAIGFDVPAQLLARADEVIE